MAFNIGDAFDKLDDVLDYVGGNFENAQQWDEARIRRENAKTQLQIQEAQLRAARQQKRDELIEKVVMFMGAVILIIVFTKFVIPPIIKAVKGK